MWNWKGGPLALIWRFVLTILVAAVSFLATDWIMPDIGVDGLGAAIAAVVVMAVFNAVIRSMVLVLVAPFSLILTGVLVLVLQVGAFLIVARLVPGVTINGFCRRPDRLVRVRDHQLGADARSSASIAAERTTRSSSARC